MDAIRWQRIQDLFHEARSLPPVDRRAYLEASCDHDQELVAEVLELITEDERTTSPLDLPLAEIASRVLGPDAPAAPRTRVGPYHIRSLLGEGGMGVVYLGERADLGSTAAIKILRDAWLSPIRRERFAAEQRTLARLEHPAIARLYDADTLADGTPWFAMEYVEGTPITDYCTQHELPIRERLALFRQVCEAVQYAHLQLVVHRDLKPSNVLVRTDGSVKLLDFGIAKQLESLDSASDQTRTAVRLMTPAYAAPEQILGEPLGVQCDVYSLGVVLYELLAGRLPHDLSRRTPAEAEAVIVQESPEKPSTVARRDAGVAAPGGRGPSRADWADLDVLCLTALHREQGRRYRTVEALIRDLDRYLDDKPLEARPDSVRYRAGKFLHRRRGSVALATMVLALVVGLSGFYTSRLTTARNAALAEAARAQRIQRFTLNLFGGGDDAAPPDSLRVVALIERGVEQAEMLEDELGVQTELLRTLGGVFHKLGKLDRADSLLSVSLQRTRAASGADELAVASSLVALGLLRSDQAKYDAAEASIREAMTITSHTVAPDHPVALEALEALGHVLVERGSYDEAIAVFDDVVRRRAAGGSSPAELAASIAELAGVHFYAGHYAESDSLNVRALDSYRYSHGSRHPRVADMLINRGAIQHELGNYAAAEQYYREVLDIQRGWYGADHPALAATSTMLARSLLFQERADEAADLLRVALAIRERVYGPNHPQVASTVNELGSIALGREQYDEAAAAYRRMLAIYQSAYGRNHYLMGVATSNLASVYMAQREQREAERLFRQALDIFRETLPPDNLNTGIAHIKLGRTLLRQGRFREAEAETSAGYRIVSAQADPSIGWLNSARQDLAAALDSMGRPEQAANYLAELK